MARPRTPVGAHGAINLKQVEGGKWRARTLFRFEDGNRRQVERFAVSRAKAENALKQALTVISAPATSGSITRTTTVATLADAYLAQKRSLNRAPRTLQTYEYNIAQHVKPGIGHLTIGEASTKRIQAFIDAVARGHGSGSAKGCRSVLSGMFALAIRNDAIRINPVSGVAGIEKTRSRTSTALPLDELPTFLERIQNDEQLRRLDVADLVGFMAGTGCRIGEALALRARDVDLARKTVTLGPSVTRIPGAGLTIHEAGKTETSNRTIVVPDATVALLAPRLALTNSEDEVVFQSLLGKLRDPANTEAAWRSNRGRLGYPDFKLHGLRKTVATALDAAGLSARDIAEYLGHKRPSMTQDVYMSRTTQSAKAAAALDSKFGVSSGSAT
ncbi:site-specific integrase [Planctomonas sp. JC2975]|uniref:tyrosine-type recombinase/integrase n=1 Tax=Planctomonas sp. JC2975 TaxID=2729626 RepID=UPI0014743999|nr:site-specific integrase [Planctomonas sp. JC2975]